MTLKTHDSTITIATPQVNSISGAKSANVFFQFFKVLCIFRMENVHHLQDALKEQLFTESGSLSCFVLDCSSQHLNHNFRVKGMVNQGDKNAQPLRRYVQTLINCSASYYLKQSAVTVSEFSLI